MQLSVHRIASRVRHARGLSHLEPAWLALEPGWNRALDRVARHGYLATINGRPMRLTYGYGGRYEKTGYEPVVCSFVTEHATPGSTVLDVGAHVGILTIAAAQRVGPTGRVYAFEPAPRTVSVLRRHLAMNDLDDRVEVVEAVVCDHEGSSEFHTLGESMAASISRKALALSPERQENASDSVLPALTLDSFCAARSIRPNLIKIDVEGAELLVLQGMSTLLEDDDVTVLCEIHPAQLRTLGGDSDKLERFLAKHGRRIQPIDTPNAAGIYHAALQPTYPEAR